jgi:hypothetical protein
MLTLMVDTRSPRTLLSVSIQTRLTTVPALDLLLDLLLLPRELLELLPGLLNPARTPFLETSKLRTPRKTSATLRSS